MSKHSEKSKPEKPKTTVNPRKGKSASQMRAAFPEVDLTYLEPVANRRDLFDDLARLSKYPETQSFIEHLEAELAKRLVYVLAYHKNDKVAPHIHAFLEEINAYAVILRNLSGAEVVVEQADADLDEHLKELAKALRNPMGRITRGDPSS